MKGVIIMIMSCLMMSGTLPFLAGATQTVKIYPTDDAYVDEYRAGTVFNGEDLRVGKFDYMNTNRGIQRIFLKFSLSGVELDNISNVKLVLRPYGGPVGGSNNLGLYLSEENWYETSLNWNNQLSASTLIESKTVSNGDLLLFDITEDIANEDDNEISFALKSQQESISNKYVEFFSSEHSGGEAYWPYLEITYDGSGTTCPSADFSNVCCQLSSLQMMGFINSFNRFETSYTPVQMMNFINKFNRFEALC